MSNKITPAEIAQIQAEANAERREVEDARSKAAEQAQQKRRVEAETVAKNIEDTWVGIVKKECKRPGASFVVVAHASRTGVNGDLGIALCEKIRETGLHAEFVERSKRSAPGSTLTLQRKFPGGGLAHCEGFYPKDLPTIKGGENTLLIVSWDNTD